MPPATRGEDGPRMVGFEEKWLILEGAASIICCASIDGYWASSCCTALGTDVELCIVSEGEIPPPGFVAGCCGCGETGCDILLMK